MSWLTDWRKKKTVQQSADTSTFKVYQILLAGQGTGIPLFVNRRPSDIDPQVALNNLARACRK